MKSKDNVPPALTLSRGKKWGFALVAFVLMPLLVLAAAEGCLRLAGYGYATDFFKRTRIGSKDYYVENDKFGLRFFPPELARSPPPIRMEAEKPAGTFRIFVLGESAALGDPRPAYGAGRYLRELLRVRYPAGKFEVICGAVTAIDSHAILPIARECARHQGDLWIIYMGNNEMIGPFGATTVFGSQASPLGMVRLNLALQRTRLGQWLIALGRKLGRGNGLRSSWGGMEMFLENQIAPLDNRKNVTYSNFQKNLEDMLAAGQRVRVPVLLSTVAVNLKDCAPFASMLDRELSATDRAAYDAARTAALRSQVEQNNADAAAEFEKAADVAPYAAELQFRWGECCLAQTNRTQALKHFENARDCDALPFRADSRINQIIRETAAKRTGPDLVFSDAVVLMSSNSPSGIPGSESFYEHVHFNFDGNYRLARAWAPQVAALLPPALTQGAKAEWASQDACERGLGLTDWNRLSVLEDMLNRLSQPPFTGQANHKERLAALQSEMQTLRKRLDSTNAKQARTVYEEALAVSPGDHLLHANYAEFLEMTGDLTHAKAEWERVTELIPQHHVAYFQTGRLLRRMGNLDEAKVWLGKAVQLRPDLAEGWLELGNIYALQGQPERALVEYDKERRLAPQDYRVYYHTGKALSKLHRGEEAIQNFERALKVRPGYWEARYALGEELAFSNRPGDAGREFLEVTRQKPGYALAHLNLGVALVQLGDLDGALAQFQETQRLDPQNQMALTYLQKVQAARARK